MRIEFIHDPEWAHKAPRPRKTAKELEEEEARRYWAAVMRLLKEESGLPKYDEEFDDWLVKNWGITVLYENEKVTKMITGMEIDDHMALLLKLKFSQV